MNVSARSFFGLLAALALMASAVLFTAVPAILIMSVPAFFMMSVPANGAELAGIITDLDGKPIADAVVYVVAVDDQAASPAGIPRGAVIDQVNRQFAPFVTVVQVGAEITFPNADNIGHNEYSVSEGMTFTLGLSRGVEATPVVFLNPGVVVIGCNIHDWMLAYVLVLDTPSFGVTGPNGTTVLRDLTPGGRLAVFGQSNDAPAYVSCADSGILCWPSGVGPNRRLRIGIRRH